MLLLCHCLATCRMWNPEQYIRRGRRCPQIYLFFLFYPYLCPWTRRPKEPFAGAVGIVRMTMHHCRTNLYGTMTLSHNPSTPNHSNSWNSIAMGGFQSNSCHPIHPAPLHPWRCTWNVWSPVLRLRNLLLLVGIGDPQHSQHLLHLLHLLLLFLLSLLHIHPNSPKPSTLPPTTLCQHLDRHSAALPSRSSEEAKVVAKAVLQAQEPAEQSI